MVISSHVSRCAAAALTGFTALSLAACGSSSAPSPSSSSSSSKATTTASSMPSSTSASATPGAAGPGGKDAGKDKAFGLVGSVSAGTVTLTGPQGAATVDVTPSTRVTELAPGQLTDVTTGECVMVRPTKDSGGPPAVTAAAVLVRQAGNGKCGHPGGHGRGVVGAVASVNGSSIVLTTADNGQTTVTVTSTTRYGKLNPADTSAITAGQCLAARGTKDGSGNLQATAVNLRPANNGQCGRGRHQGG